MNWTNFIFASYEIILAIVFSLITVFITKKVLNRSLIKAGIGSLYENTATAIFGGSIIISVLLLVHASLMPAVDMLNVMVMSEHELTAGMFATSFAYFLLFFLISIVVSIGLLFLTVKIYFMATRKVDELEEIKNKNVAVSIVIAAVILSITLSVKPSLEHFIFSMVNYEAIKESDMEVGDDETIIYEDIELDSERN